MMDNPLFICVPGLLFLIFIACVVYLLNEDRRMKRLHERMETEREQVRASPCPVCGSRPLVISMTVASQFHVICIGCGASAIGSTPMETYGDMSLPSRPVRRTLPRYVCRWCGSEDTLVDITACEDVGTVQLCTKCGFEHHDYTPETLPAPPIGKRVIIRGIEFDRSEVLEALAASGSSDQDQKGTGPE